MLLDVLSDIDTQWIPREASLLTSSSGVQRLANARDQLLRNALIGCHPPPTHSCFKCYFLLDADYHIAIHVDTQGHRISPNPLHTTDPTHSAGTSAPLKSAHPKMQVKISGRPSVPGIQALHSMRKLGDMSVPLETIKQKLQLKGRRCAANY